jgi:hypothetical protein
MAAVPPVGPIVPPIIPVIPPVVPAVPVIPFLLFPGQNVILDLAGSDRDIKMYHKAIIPNVGATKYDLKPEGLKSFLESVRVRAKLYNWMNILDVPDAAGVVLSILDQYGNISMDECRAYATVFMGARNRDTQNSVMLYQFLLNSIEEKWKATLLSKMAIYTINGEQEGLCFLRLLISRAQVSTLATVSVLRNSLGNLDKKIIEFAGNISAFNDHVQSLNDKLAAFGETTPDSMLMNCLFRAYATVEDDDFRQYIKNKRINYEERREINTPDEMMELADSQYKIRVEEQNWKSPNKKDEEITILKAQIEAKIKTPYDPNQHKWKKVAPKDNIFIKEVEGRVWNWCKNHKAWTQHTYEACRGVTARSARANPAVVTPPPSASENMGTPVNTNPTVQVNPILSSIVEGGAIRYN